MTLEICSIPVCTRKVKRSFYSNINSIAFFKLVDTLRTDMFKFDITSTMFTEIMMNLLRGIDININKARVLALYRCSCIKRVNSIVRASDSSWCGESITDIIVDCFPNNWIYLFILIVLFWERFNTCFPFCLKKACEKSFTWFFAFVCCMIIRKILGANGSESNNSFWCIFYFLYWRRGLFNSGFQLIMFARKFSVQFLLKLFN